MCKSLIISLDALCLEGRLQEKNYTLELAFSDDTQNNFVEPNSKELHN